jgi:uncharacterized protein (TIGR02145 family)
MRILFSLFLALTLAALQSSCKKEDIPASFIYGQITDFEGNAYKTVTIGSQTWMAENLKSIKLNDGTAIPLVTSNNSWSNMTTPAYCYYGNDSTTYKSYYGALYNWHTVATNKLCPSGWHVPTLGEWTTLNATLGVDTIAGGMLKEGGTAHWSYPNTHATNSSGFTALPTGYRFYNGSFQNFGISGNWWSSTAANSDAANYTFLVYSDGKLGKNSLDNTYGFSVRCVKD